MIPARVGTVGHSAPASAADALVLARDQFESRTLAGGFEAMRIFTEAHPGTPGGAGRAAD